MSERIAIVEDEADIAEVLEYNLQREGYETITLGRGDTALEVLQKKPPDLVLLDLMLPGLDGLEVCRALRRNVRMASVPIIMLTAKGDEIDRVVGLELGADDYVAKPFSPREVVLRVKAVLRRGQEAENPADEMRAGTLRLDIPGHRLFIADEEVTLTATEFRLLQMLMEGTGRVLTREMLLTRGWGYSEDVDSRTVDTHVRRLRRKLDSEAERIETVIGVGYRFRN